MHFLMLIIRFSPVRYVMSYLGRWIFGTRFFQDNFGPFLWPYSSWIFGFASFLFFT